MFSIVRLYKIYIDIGIWGIFFSRNKKLFVATLNTIKMYKNFRINLEIILLKIQRCFVVPPFTSNVQIPIMWIIAQRYFMVQFRHIKVWKTNSTSISIQIWRWYMGKFVPCMFILIKRTFVYSHQGLNLDSIHVF